MASHSGHVGHTTIIGWTARVYITRGFWKQWLNYVVHFKLVIWATSVRVQNCGRCLKHRQISLRYGNSWNVQLVMAYGGIKIVSMPLLRNWLVTLAKVDSFEEFLHSFQRDHTHFDFRRLEWTTKTKIIRSIEVNGFRLKIYYFRIWKA